MVKEIRVWTEKRKENTTKDTRSQQIDPLFSKNKNLLYYLKLAKEQKVIRNFARFNKNFPEEIKEATIVGKYKFIEDVTQQRNFNGIDPNGKAKYDPLPVYHVVCPANTYWINKKCHTELFNRVDLIVVPKWDKKAKDLNWQFSLITSSLLSEELVKKLNTTWTAPHRFVLQKGLNS